MASPTLLSAAKRGISRVRTLHPSALPDLESSSSFHVCKDLGCKCTCRCSVFPCSIFSRRSGPGSTRRGSQACKVQAANGIGERGRETHRKNHRKERKVSHRQQSREENRAGWVCVLECWRHQKPNPKPSLQNKLPPQHVPGIQRPHPCFFLKNPSGGS